MKIVFGLLVFMASVSAQADGRCTANELRAGCSNQWARTAPPQLLCCCPSTGSGSCYKDTFDACMDTGANSAYCFAEAQKYCR